MLVDEGSLVIIDEVQKLPQLLDEVHWLMVNRGLRFILCGSSARKLKRSGTNLLGGRAVRVVLYPFVSAELPNFDLMRAVRNGMLPRHYMVAEPWRRLQAYVGDYLREEIMAEALTRNLGAFTRFLEAAALTNGEILNYQNIAAECGVSASTVREYFAILEETMVGYTLQAYRHTVKRRLIQAPKFYFFDVGIANYLLNRRNLAPGSADFGHALEHLIVQELVAYMGYTSGERPTYWRTASGFEVDIVLGDARVAIEVKSTREVQPRHLKGLKAFREEHPQAKLIVVSLDAAPRLVDGIEIWPATAFLQRLWQGKV